MSIVSESTASPICDICNRSDLCACWNFELECHVCEECRTHAMSSVELVKFTDQMEGNNKPKEKP